jgi:hypothetical protein
VEFRFENSSYVFSVPPLLLATYALRFGYGNYALCLFVASRPKAGPLTSRPGGPLLKLVRFCRYALCALRFALCFFSCLEAEGRSSNLKARRADPRAAEGVALSTGGAYASNWFFSNSSLLAPNTLRYFKRQPRKIFCKRKIWMT